jgi:Cohesin domain
MPLRHLYLRLLAPAALALSALAAAGFGAGLSGGTRPQAAATVGGLGVDSCIEVGVGDTFDVNIMVSDVERLLAWDIFYAYDRDTLEVTGRNVRRLLETLPSSNIFDLSDAVPNRTGLYRIGAADTGGTDAAESGSGILATLTLKAKDAGVSWSAVYRGDVDGNGSVDLGPTLTALGGVHIDDNDGDGIFDGPISRGQIAVDTDCVDPAPTPPAPAGFVIEPHPTTTVELQTASPSPTDDPSGNDGSPTPTANPRPSPSATAIRGEGTIKPPDSGGSGSSLPAWLIAVAAGAATFGVVFSYIVYRSARRPA